MPRILPLAGFVLVPRFPSPFKGEAGRGMVFVAPAQTPSPPDPPLEGEG